MEHDLAFLHTASVHVETFSRLSAEVSPGLRVRHVVRESLLDEVRKNGATERIVQRVHAAMSKAASSRARVDVCTCSTIGGIAEATAGPFRAMRIDRAMADTAVKRAERILVVAALESTLGPTLELLQDSARAANVNPQITKVLAPGAWARFEAGDKQGYASAIEDTIRANLETLMLSFWRKPQWHQLPSGVGILG